MDGHRQWSEVTHCEATLYFSHFSVPGWLGWMGHELCLPRDSFPPCLCITQPMLSHKRLKLWDESPTSHLALLGRAMQKFTHGKYASGEAARGEWAGSGPSYLQVMDAVPLQVQGSTGGAGDVISEVPRAGTHSPCPHQRHLHPHPQLRSHRACGDLCTVPLGHPRTSIRSRGDCSEGQEDFLLLAVG